MWAVLEFCKTLLSDKIRRRFSVISSVDKLRTKLGTGDTTPLLTHYIMHNAKCSTHFT